MSTKNTKCPQKIPNVHKIYQMAVKRTIWPQNTPTSTVARPSKIYPNLDFWFENMPSGNPDPRACTKAAKFLTQKTDIVHIFPVPSLRKKNAFFCGRKCIFAFEKIAIQP
jgi:hypothetical protein